MEEELAEREKLEEREREIELVGDWAELLIELRLISDMLLSFWDT